jgi:hypothetical protein
MKRKIEAYYTESYKRFIIVLFLCLLFGHLVVQLFFSNILINLIGFAILFYFLYYQAFLKDYFVFVLCIYGLSYFQYANAQGGIFNLLSFIILIIHMVIKKNFYLIRNPIKSINFLLIIVIVSHFFGLIFKNRASIDQKLLGTMSLFGYILIFNFISRIDITTERIKLFIMATSLLFGFSLLVSINKFYRFYNSYSPMLGGETHFGSDNLGGTLGPSPIYGELGLLVLTFLLPFMFSSTTQQAFKIKIRNISIAVFFALITILMANSRSTIILAVVSIGVYLFVANLAFSKLRRNMIRNIVVLSIIGVAFAISAPLLNLDAVIGRFELVDPENINVETVISGEGINRSTAFEIGRSMIERETWMIGYGWGTVKQNRRAWFGEKDIERSDPHSIYYSLPMLFGWVGSIAFILIFLIVIYRLFKLCFLQGKRLHEFILPSLGIAFLLLFFLINEYKITALSAPHYFMIIWIWIGMGNSLVIKFSKKNKSRNHNNVSEYYHGFN